MTKEQIVTSHVERSLTCKHMTGSPTRRVLMDSDKSETQGGLVCLIS